jgi:uncharacterized protein YfaS (alpha-2-macroglobulin family)
MKKWDASSRFGLRLRPSKKSLAALSLTALVGFVSCFPGAKAPEVNPSRTLELEKAGAGKTPKSPFDVVFGGPRGTVEDVSEVSVVFNRPMRALEIAGEESSSPVKIATAEGQTPKGAWRWMGTSAIIFAPEKALPRATSYGVKIPKGTKALDGSVLEKDVSFDFETPRPRLIRTEPGESASHLLPSNTFDLRFNQPVDLKEIQRAFSILAGDPPNPKAKDAKDAKDANANKGPKAVEFVATYPKADVPTLVRLSPKAPLPLDTLIALHADPSMRGTEGPLPVGNVADVNMRTYGPLSVSGVECYASTPDKKCAARGSYSISFSNRVLFADAVSHFHVDPPVAVDFPKEDPKYKTSWLSLPARFRPASTYHVTITKGLKDEYGQVLARDVNMTVTTGDEWPNVQIGVSGVTFEANGAKPVPLASINTPSYEMIASELDETGVMKLLGPQYYRGDMASWNDAAALNGVHVQTVRPSAGKNAFEVKRVEVDKVLKKGKGAVVLGVKFDRTGSQYNRVHSDVRVLNVTDLGISAKESRFGSMVWVTRLSDAKPVAGATVSLRDKEGKVQFTGTTNGDGLVNVPREKWSPGTNWYEDDGTMMFVRSGDDFAFRRMGDRLDSWRYQPGVEMGGRVSPVGMMFTDRGIYKLGETIHAKALFRMREQKGTSSLKGEEVSLSAQDSNGTEFWSQTEKLGDYGEVAVDVPIPADARLGVFSLRASVGKKNVLGDDTHGNAFAQVQVAAYKPAEFKTTVDTDKTSYVHGDKAGFNVRGDYLFGAPMGGAHVRYTVTRSVTGFSPPNTEGFSTDDEAYAWAIQDRAPRGGATQTGQGDLDAKGTFTASTALGGNPTTSPELLSIEGEIEDVSRQTVAGRTSVIVHPASMYVALKGSDDFFIEKDKPIAFQALAVEPSGKRRAGETIHVELLRRTWKTVTEANDEDVGHYISKAVDEKVGACDVKSDMQPVSCPLKAGDAGYFIVRATVADGKGNRAAASTSIYATGSSEIISWAMSDASTLELVTDKKSYEAGQTARVLIKNPFTEAHAVITVERAGIYKQWQEDVKGPMPTISVPVTEDLRPNAYVSVELLRGRTTPAPTANGGRGLDLGKPQFRVGYTEISINPEARRLKVAVEPLKKNFGPGEQVDADLTVKDRNGKGVKSDVTFYAVDEGVLMLTDYKTPDPLPTFMAARPLAVLAMESRDSLARILKVGGFLGDDKGGDGGGGGPTTSREDFRSTAAFIPSVRTDANGKAHVTFKLPDSLTTYRLMAVAAAEDDRFGFGDNQVVTSRPLMARPALPRFMRAGDTMDAGVIISTKNLPAGDVEVAIKGEGVELVGETKKTVNVPANGNVEVRFAMKTPSPAKMKLQFSAKGLGQKDDVTVVRDVKLPMVTEAVALYGDTKESAGEQLGNLASVRNDFGSLEVKLSSSALVGLDSGVQALIEYPYGCAEQLTSRVVPLVALSGIAKEYGIKLPEDLKPIIEKALHKILLDQQEGGGFGYWPDSQHPSVWLTAYVLWGLSLAQEGGYHVPDDVIPRATAFLRTALAQMDKDDISRVSGAFIVDVLATIGKPDAGYMTRLYDEREKLPIFARAWLAHAIAVGADKTGEARSKWQPQTEELMRDLNTRLRVTPTGAIVTENVGDKYAVILDSDARTTALVLRALVAMDKEHPLAPRIAKGLLAERRGGTWRSTQETAWSLVALGAYAKAVEADAPDFKARVFYAGKEAFEATFKGKSVHSEHTEIPMPKLMEPGSQGGTLAFDMEGSGHLFYEARLRYARREMPTDSIDRGFFVKKYVRSVKPEGLHDALNTLPQQSSVSAQAGDMVLVDLIIVTPDPREQVVIDDPLPAGLEPVQTNLATTARSLNVTEFGGEGDDTDYQKSDDDAVANARAYGYAWYHREFDDDKVLTFVDHMAAGMYHYRYLARATTVGTFAMPPAKAECMYEPETFGRTGGSSFEVKSK